MSSRKFIVTTTINAPTEAIERFDAVEDFTLIVIGDRKTPPNYTLKHGLYIPPDEQETRYPRLSRLLGWNCIQRRNIGFLVALEMGADIVASIDDDNIPFDDWGQNLLVGRKIEMRSYDCAAPAFDPIGATNYPHLWHRGFPIQLVQGRDYSNFQITEDVVRIQADFWNGDPDIDAVCRMIHGPSCDFKPDVFPFTSKTMAPFNSQNTFLEASLIPHYFMYTGIGRMDDIWGAYYLQAATGMRPVFGAATVEQRRNVHDLTRDFSQEVIGYERTLSLVDKLKDGADNLFTELPGSSVAAFLEYRETALAIMGRRPSHTR